MMRRMKQLLPLWVLLAILLVTGGVVLGLDRVQTKAAQELIVPLADGVWMLHPAREPELVYAWKSETHFTVRCKNSKHGLFLFENDQIWQLSNDGVSTLIAENQSIDYELGAKGIVLDSLSRKKSLYDVYYIVRDSQRWESVEWCDQRVSICTRAKISKYMDAAFLQEVYHTPELPLNVSTQRGVYTVATREDGLHCIVAVGPGAAAQRVSPWFPTAPKDEILFSPGGEGLAWFVVRTTSDTVWTEKRYTILSPEALSEPEITTETYGSPQLRYSHLIVQTWPQNWPQNPYYFYRTPLGSLYYRGSRKECVDRFSDIRREQFLNGQVDGAMLLVPTDTGTRVYAEFPGYGWKRFDLPAEMD